MTLASETFSFQAVTDVSLCPCLTRPVLPHTVFHFLNTLSETEFQKTKDYYATFTSVFYHITLLSQYKPVLLTTLHLLVGTA